jgi:MFS transporter, DHA1 family, multidrug resistance protein
MLAGVFLGRLADRIAPPLIGMLSAVGAGACMLAIGLFPFVEVLFPVRFLYAFCAGGLDPVFQVWLSKSTPAERRGTIFGWSVTAKSMGWSLSPMASGGVAMLLGTRAVFLVAPLLFCGLLPLIRIVSRRAKQMEQRQGADGSGVSVEGRKTTSAERNH